MRGLSHVLEEAEAAVEGFRNAFADKYGNASRSNGSASAVGSAALSHKQTASRRVSRDAVTSHGNVRSELNYTPGGRTDGLTSSTMKMLKNCQLAVHEIAAGQGSVSRPKRSKRNK